jgi:hypothetical protein
VTSAAPEISRLLRAGTPFLTDAGKVTEALTPMMACIRPYAPEAGGAIVGMGAWDAYYTMKPPNTIQAAAMGDPPRAKGRVVGDKVRQHYGRAIAQASTTSFHAYPAAVTPALFGQISGKQYAFPRPPGIGVNQPQFLPQCGAGPESLDPSKDPEQGR